MDLFISDNISSLIFSNSVSLINLSRFCKYSLLCLNNNIIPSSVKKSEWMTYRTGLRNLTQGLTTIEQVNAVAFPLKPQN